MFKYTVTIPETGETLVINFDERPTEEELREAVEKASASRRGEESRSATGVIDAIKDYGILFQGGFQKGMLDLYAMGVSRPAGKLAALFGDEEDGKYYERRAQGFSEAGRELMQEAQDRAKNDSYGGKIATALGGMIPVVGSTVLAKNPKAALAMASGTAGVQTAGADNYRYLEIEAQRLQEEEGLGYQDARDKAAGRVLLPSLVSGAKTAGITAAGGFAASKLGLAGVETGAAVAQVSRTGLSGTIARGLASKSGPVSAKTKQFIGSVALEGVEEGLDSLASSGIDWSEGFDPDMTLGKAVLSAADDFVVGVGAGGVVQGLREGVDKVKERRSRKAKEKQARAERAASEERARVLAEEIERNKQDYRDQILALDSELSEKYPAFKKILENSAHQWAKKSLGDDSISLGDALDMPLARIEKARKLREIEENIEDVRSEPETLETAQQKAERKAIVAGLEADRASILSGETAIYPPAVQSVLDSLGVKTVKEAFDIQTGKAQPPARTQMTVSADAPAPDLGAPIEAEEAPSGSKQSDVLPETFEVPPTPLKTQGQAKAARRNAAEPFVSDPKTSFEQAQTPPEVLSPDIPSKQAELSGVDIGSGITRKEAAAMKAGPLASAEQLADLRSGRRKQQEREQRGRGTVTRYDTPEKEVIVSEVVNSADVSDSAPSDEVSNVIKSAEEIAASQNIKLTAEDKIEILDRLQVRAGEVESQEGGATIQDGLEVFSQQLDSIRKKLKKSSRGMLSANTAAVTSMVDVALGVAKLAAQSGMKLSDVVDVGLSSLRKNVKGKRYDSSADQFLEKLAGYIQKQSEEDSSKSDFGRKNLLAARRSRKLKEAIKEAGLDLGTVFPDIKAPEAGQTFARVNVYSNMFGNISGESARGDASSVLAHIKEDFTRNTTPTRAEIPELFIQSSADPSNPSPKTLSEVRRAEDWANNPKSRPKLGSKVKGRINIPVVERFQKYVASITDGKKTNIGYDNIFVVDVLKGTKALEVLSPDKAVLDIAEGEKPKTTLAYVNGGYVQASISPEGVVETLDADGNTETISPKDLHDARKFLQIAMNPKRANYWYSRSTGRRIVKISDGARMYQIGGTVFVRRGKGTVVTEAGNSAAVLARLRKAKKKVDEYISSARRSGRMNSAPVDVLAAHLANASLSAAIQSIVYGGMAVDAAIRAAYNALDFASKKQVDFDRFSQHLRERLSVAIGVMDITGSEKAGIETAAAHFSKPSMADVRTSEAAAEKIQNPEKVLNEQEEALLAELATAAPLMLEKGSLTKMFWGTFNDIVRGNNLGLSLLSQRIKVALAKRANYEGSYRILDRDGDEISYISSEQEAEVSAYRLARAEGKPTPEISDESLRIVEEIDRIFLLQGEDARQARVLQRQKDGSYAVGKFGIGEGGYYHTIKAQYIKALQALRSGVKLSEQQKADLNEFIDRMQLRRETEEESFAEAEKWASRNVSSGATDSYIGEAGTASMVRARTVKIPPSVIDLSPSAFIAQSRNVAKTLSEIEAYGQNTDSSSDLFSHLLKLLNTSRFKGKEGVKEVADFIESARKSAYEIKPDGSLNELASSKGATFWGKLVSVIMLASFMSGVTQLTSLGFIASKAVRLRSPMSFVKGFLSALTSGDIIKGDEVRGLGLVAGAANAMAGNYLDNSSVSKGWRQMTELAANYALKLITIPDQFTRTVNLHQAKYLIEEVNKSIAEGVNPEMVAEFRKHAERMGLDPDAVLREGTKEQTEYLTTSVFEVQGSYRLQQLPAMMRNPSLQFALKFSPFAFQVGSEIAEQLQSEKGDSPISRGQIRYLLYTAAIMGLTEELRAHLFLKLFGRESNAPTYEEILSQETLFGKGKLTVQRAFQNLLNVGVFGQFGYIVTGSRYSKGDFSLGDLANFSVLMKGFGLAGDLATGKKTPNQVANEFTRDFIKIYRDATSIGSQIESVRNEWEPAMAAEKRRQMFKIRNIKERYEADTGNKIPRGYGEATELTKYSKQVSERIMLGDVRGAREKAKEYAMMSPDGEAAWGNLTSSLKRRSPVASAGLQTKQQQVQFAAWAKNNLSNEDYNDILSANREYMSTALRAGLITIEGETPYPDTLAEMKEAMSGKPTVKKRPAPITYKDLLNRRDRILQTR